MDKFKIIIFFIFIAFLLALGWYAKAGKMYNQEDPALNTEIQNIYSEMGKIGQVLVTIKTATPGNAYTGSIANIWSGTSYTIQSPKCNLLIICILNIYGYQTGATAQTCTQITDGSNVGLSTHSSTTHTHLSCSTECTVMGYKAGLTKGQAITLKLRGSSTEANRARLDDVEMYIIELQTN